MAPVPDPPGKAHDDGPAGGAYTPSPLAGYDDVPGTDRRRVWVQGVVPGVTALRIRLDTISRRPGRADPHSRAVADGVRRLLTQAEQAVYRIDPKPRRWGNWWRGTLIEAAYRSLHTAEAEIVVLYDDDEVEAEVPEALARIEAALNRDDPRRQAALTLSTMPPGPHRNAVLRKVIEVGHSAGDQQHSRVRSFRNVVLVTALLIAALVTAFAVVVALDPDAVPLCFQPNDVQYCPAGRSSPSSADVVVVAMLGLLGGSLAAAVSIRHLKGTSTPYDVPVSLALLKVPAGALTAIGALIAIRGEFVPGLSALDSQEQILAYAIVFGYAQQVLTRLIDRRAQTVLNSVQSKDADVPRDAIARLPAPATTTGTAADGPTTTREVRATPRGRWGRLGRRPA